MDSKYHAKKAEYGGMKFDSKKELKRYLSLVEMERRGDIKDLRRQVKFVLIPTQYADGKCCEKECSYYADFVYEKDGKTVVEDVKGYRKGAAYSIFTIKRKLMYERYQIRVTEV